MIIDFHTHIFPDKLAAKAISALEKSGNVKAFTDATLNGLISSMDKSGIDYSVTSKPSQTPNINDFAIQINANKKIFSFGGVHPLFHDLENELKRIKNAGLLGIKLHPDFQGLFIDDDNMVKVIEMASNLGLIVMIHAGMDISFPEVHRCTPKRLKLATDHIKNRKIIAAHMGGYNYLDEAEEFIIGNDFYIDTSFTIDRSDNRQIVRMIKSHDPKKILFGSDSPWGNQFDSLNSLLNLNITNFLKSRILFDNASRLLCNRYNFI